MLPSPSPASGYAWFVSPSPFRHSHTPPTSACIIGSRNTKPPFGKVDRVAAQTLQPNCRALVSWSELKACSNANGAMEPSTGRILQLYAATVDEKKAAPLTQRPKLKNWTSYVKNTGRTDSQREGY